tara:strand:+ start:4411 stop:4926 length:516 start_codon:yes stop_codon:yes gene_type:complete
MNEENQVSQETQVAQSEQPQSQDESVDYKALYLEEVQNAKKLRKRSQDAELKLSDITKKQETQKVKQMQEKEQYKELYESVAPYKEKWETYESNRREALLSKLPEEDRESMSSKDLDVLEYVVKVRNESKPNNPAHNPSMPRKNVIEKSWSEMSEAEKRVYYQEQQAKFKQ